MGVTAADVEGVDDLVNIVEFAQGSFGGNGLCTEAYLEGAGKIV